ncbi:ABC transporter substrate-binding protein [Nocardioides sp. YIM 152315]|uniref:ABC transporter substrate-binding protein n=1 Tax=Nocardioides sp. YIM 152315 TaxID=3031760 RepID=UPI0023DA03D3|nr:ABC transporter substrate-binding protein [Nocardioides sp. YIM 152315]MDF1603121.1 ABC transporter substrate-binding protein [Nocardioides sp. YIM 152315]
MNRSRTATWVRLMAGTAALSFALTACGDDSDGGDEPAADDTPTASESAPAADSLTNDKCAGNQTSADTFRAGGILPLTGNLAYLGPPEISGVGLAVSDINAAGGVGGAQACHDIQDSGDSTDMSVSTASAGTLVASKPSVVIGAASSSVSLNVVDTFADNKIVEISPANTAVDLSGYSPWYFRTAPPDGIQGNALGTLISTDGYTKVGFLVFNDTYGTGLRNAVQATVEGAGGSCVYGCKGDGDEFPAGQTTFSAEVSGVLAAKPDAIVVLAFDETKSIVPELKAQGWDMAKTYYTDGNTADYTKDFEPGTLEGAQGTIPGADPEQGFKDRLVAWYDAAEGQKLTDFAYGAESYDATILAALAAVKGGATDPKTIRDNLAAVSGATDGEECKSYADCVALLDEGSEIRYAGPSGIGPIDKQNDPSSAFVGIYTYNADNKNELTSTVEGSK